MSLNRVSASRFTVVERHTDNAEFQRFKESAQWNDEVLGIRFLNPVPLFNERELNRIDPTRLGALLSNYPGQHATMKAVRSVLSVLNTGELLERVHRWLTITLPIFSDSFGSVWKATIDGQDGAAVALKVTRSTTLLHEAVVGTILNSLRGELPNFAYFFTTFGCDAPKFVDGDWRWCVFDGKNPAPYVVQEYLGSTTLNDIILEISVDEINRIIVHLLMALWVAGDRLGFTHNDLHHYNVMIRKLSSPEQFVFDVGTPLYLVNDLIPCLIDFELSRVAYQGTTFYSPRTMDNMNASRYFPARDVFNLVQFAARTTMSGPRYDYFIYLMEYFVDDPHAALAIADQQYIFLPYIPFSDFNHLDFLKYINRRYPTDKFLGPQKFSAPLFGEDDISEDFVRDHLLDSHE